MKSRQIHELGELFAEVQLKNILGDGKTFPDCIPKGDLQEITDEYHKRKTSPGFELKKFILDNFILPAQYSSGFKSDATKTPSQHIESLWDVLTRKPDNERSSIISLPHPYVVPGGRFREIYYWDSFFTMLGLKASNRFDLIRNMIDNFTFLIDQFGYIPNGNRSYFLGRSQPPFFSMMIELLADHDGPDTFARYQAQLVREYEFWMEDSDSPSVAQHHTVQLKEGEILNRYWDVSDAPRPESYKEDVELSQHSKQRPSELFRNLRAAAESGWDFSSRWFSKSDNLASTHTTDIVPVDLNCLLVHLEKTLARSFQITGDSSKASHYTSLASKRILLIRKYLWSEEKKFFFDFDFAAESHTAHHTLAAAFPLFVNVATPDQAAAVRDVLKKDFLKFGGLTTTLQKTGQQWDAPNGWAPLQWVAFRGLLNYGFDEVALEVRNRWMETVERVYNNTGKMTEKYDVWNENGEAGGGEYPNQDGFGWTNGVYLAMKSNGN